MVCPEPRPHLEFPHHRRRNTLLQGGGRLSLNATHPETRPRVVIAERYSASAIDRLRSVAEVVDLVGAERGALLGALHNADALLVRSYVAVDDELLAHAPRLKVVARGGVGLDNIDVARAHSRGLVVVHTPAASTRAVAEHTLGLLLAVERCLAVCDADVRADRFNERRRETRFRELGDLTLGILGMGRIGSAVGRCAALGFGMRVIYHDIIPVGPFDFPQAAVTRDRLLADSDVLSLHVPLTAATRGMIDGQALAQMRTGAILINTARGALVDAAALADALRAEHLAGAGIDVFAEEPPAPDHPLLTAPNVVLSPHVAGRSQVALARMNDVVTDVIAVLNGQRPRHPAHPDEF
jgi:phosphoglycerate dehydrogenase-like enzyme